MSTATLAVAVLLFAPSLEAQITQSTLAPSYSTASITNAVTNLTTGFAPNSILSIYGSNLSNDTVGQTAASNSLPTTVDGVAVYFGSGAHAAGIFYVSPHQINVLVPYFLGAGPTPLVVNRQGTVGPTVTITLTDTAPGLFQASSGFVLATHADNSLVTAASPASAGEVIVLYAVGLGQTIPALTGAIAIVAAKIADLPTFNVLLDGVAVSPSSILYAGVAPGFAGLYQINVALPAPLPSNPELRISIGPQISPAGLNLPTQ